MAAFRWVKALRVQICGAGMAGSYLYMLLSKDFDVGIKDVRAEPDCRCAWGFSYSETKELYKEIGINVDDYLLSKPEFVIRVFVISPLSQLL